MALISGATYTYKESTTDNVGLMLVIKNRAVEQGWIELKNDTLNLFREVVLKAPDGSFCVGLSELTGANCYNIEIQIFKDFNDTVSLNSQLLSIPKDNFKNFQEGTHPPQIVCSVNTDMVWLQITPDYISCVVKNPTNVYTSFYAGRFNSYAQKEQYSLPLFCGGSGQSEDNIIVNDTPCDSSIDSLTFDSFSNYMFARRDLPTSSSWKSGDYFLTPDGRWSPLGYGTQSVDSYPTLSTSNLSTYFSNGTIFPIAALQHSTKGSMIAGEYLIRPVTIISNPDYAEKTTMMGEIFNIYRIEDETLNAEDEITVDGEDYIVFHDVYRDTNSNNLFCMKVI